MSSSYLTKLEVQRMLGVNAFGMWRLARKCEKFPKPDQKARRPVSQDSEEVWGGTQVYSWAAATAEFAHRGALLLRPLPHEPAPGRWAGYRDTPHGPAMDWDTDLGTIRILHSTEHEAATEAASALARSGNKDGIATVCALFGDVGFRGPALVAADTAHPAIEYEASWGDVGELVGQVLPWWPGLLRQSTLIREWRPGAAPTEVEVPANDDERILRRAAANPHFDVTSRAAATDMANTIRNERIQHTALEVRIFCKEGYGETPNQVVAGAVPDTRRHPLPVVEDRELVRPGWQKVALRTDSGASGKLWHTTYNGTTWSEPKLAAVLTPHKGLALASYGGRLHAVYVNDQSDRSTRDRRLRHVTFDVTSWSAPTILDGFQGIYQPALLTYRVAGQETDTPPHGPLRQDRLTRGSGTQPQQVRAAHTGGRAWPRPGPPGYHGSSWERG
ncbi:hypothetical protein ACIOD1_33015 [Streptomyces sp. NPDC088097]|uniref:hypothetical protein n=1 Tax=Streptomyces sp. NPDC088097 TaxID=3365823 RepID=UPI0038031AB8